MTGIQQGVYTEVPDVWKCHKCGRKPPDVAIVNWTQAEGYTCVECAGKDLSEGRIHVETIILPGPPGSGVPCGGIWVRRPYEPGWAYDECSKCGSKTEVYPYEPGAAS